MRAPSIDRWSSITMKNKRPGLHYDKNLEEEQVYEDPIVTELVKLDKFYPAEEYHHNYYARNPEQAYCSVVIAPKLARFRKNIMKSWKNHKEKSLSARSGAWG